MPLSSLPHARSLPALPPSRNHRADPPGIRGGHCSVCCRIRPCCGQGRWGWVSTQVVAPGVTVPAPEVRDATKPARLAEAVRLDACGDAHPGPEVVDRDHRRAGVSAEGVLDARAVGVAHVDECLDPQLARHESRGIQAGAHRIAVGPDEAARPEQDAAEPARHDRDDIAHATPSQDLEHRAPAVPDGSPSSLLAGSPRRPRG